MLENNKKIDITSLKKARDVFERFRVDMVDDRDKAGAVQAFEFCLELSWKSMMKVLAAKFVDVGTPKDTLRAAEKAYLIPSADIWMKFLKMRNLTSHIYREEYLEEVVANFDKFSVLLEELVDSLENALKND